MRSLPTCHAVAARPGRFAANRRGLLIALAVALLLATGAGNADAKDAPKPSGPPPPEVAALLDGDVDRQWAALATLRADPAAARASLVQALSREETPPGRWRLAHRMIEFGQADDLPLLLKVRGTAQNEWERRIVEGAVRALYDPVAPGTSLEGLVLEFSFVQTRRPLPVEDGDPGTWRLSRWSLQDYHRAGLSPEVIRAVQPLRGKAFTSREQLLEAVQKRLGPQPSKTLEQRLLASAETVPPRARLEGLARVRLYNSLTRPLLLRVGLDAWFGRFVEPLEPAWVYLLPGQVQTVDLPVSPQGSLERPAIRLDLRLSEINGPYIPGFHKLYLQLQP